MVEKVTAPMASIIGSFFSPGFGFSMIAMMANTIAANPVHNRLCDRIKTKAETAITTHQSEY